ncbi:unnamed protein product, partial [Laminaria digitata]
GERCSPEGRYLILDASGNVEAVLPSQMRLIDCAHAAGITAPLAAELAGMVSPTMPWVCQSPEGDDASGAAVAAAAAAGEAGGGGAGVGLSAILQDGGGV